MVIFQAEVEVQAAAVEMAISKEEGEVAAEVYQIGILSQRDNAGTDFLTPTIFTSLFLVFPSDENSRKLVIRL